MTLYMYTSSSAMVVLYFGLHLHVCFVYTYMFDSYVDTCFEILTSACMPTCCLNSGLNVDPWFGLRTHIWVPGLN